MLALLSLLACDPEVGCTLVGCEGRLQVDTLLAFGDAAPSELTATLTVGGREISCAFDPLGGAASCVDVVQSDPLVLDFLLPMGAGAPETVHLVLTGPDGTLLDEALTPAWEEPVFPNGVECDGEDGGCVSGTAAVE